MSGSQRGHTPETGPGQIRVRHAVCGLNFIDVYQRSGLAPGPGIIGPAVIEEGGSVTLVPPGFQVACHERGALILTRIASEVSP